MPPAAAPATGPILRPVHVLRGDQLIRCRMKELIVGDLFTIGGKSYTLDYHCGMEYDDNGHLVAACTATCCELPDGIDMPAVEGEEVCDTAQCNFVHPQIGQPL